MLALQPQQVEQVVYPLTALGFRHAVISAAGNAYSTVVACRSSGSPIEPKGWLGARSRVDPRPTFDEACF